MLPCLAHTPALALQVAAELLRDRFQHVSSKGTNEADPHDSVSGFTAPLM